MRKRGKKKLINIRNILFLLCTATLFAFAGFQVYDLISTGIPVAADREIVISGVPDSPFLSAGGAGEMPASTNGEACSLFPHRAAEGSYGEEVPLGKNGRETCIGFFLSGLRVDTAEDYLVGTSEREAVESALYRETADQPSFLADLVSAGEAPTVTDGRGGK